jgi:hypothetical protein
MEEPVEPHQESHALPIDHAMNLGYFADGHVGSLGNAVKPRWCGERAIEVMLERSQGVDERS